MGAGFSVSRLPEIAPQLAAGAGISIGFELLRRFVISRNRPASLKDGKDDQYDNIMVSFLHSSVSSALVLYFFWKNPEALTNLGGSGNYQELTTLFTYSYVWYDLFDMLRSNGFNPFNMKEMMVHHSIMIGGGLTVMLDKVYGNFTLYALSMEVNSIFLHGRALLQMCNKRDTAAFKMVSLLNLLTNVTHRLAVNYGIHKWAGPNGFYYGYLMNLIIVFLNLKLLYTCVRRDLLESPKAIEKKSE